MENQKNMSLAAAFRYRGKLKRKIAAITGIIAANSIAVEESEVELKNEAYETRSMDGDVQLLVRLNLLMEKINTAVDEANNGARSLINTINRCKDMVKLFADVHCRIISTPLTKNEYDYECEKHIKVPLVPLYNNKWTDELKAAKRELNTAEELLNEYNAKAVVSFCVEEDLDLLVEAA